MQNIANFLWRNRVSIISSFVLLLFYGCSSDPSTSELVDRSKFVVEGTEISSPWKTIEQWAAIAEGSSEYANPEWGAEQAVGEPDTLRCGDLPSAWASASSDSQEDWLNLYYNEPVYAKQIIIYQTFNPDQVVKVDLVDKAGYSYRVYTETPNIIDDCPFELVINFPLTEYLTDHVIITVDQSQLGLGWNEIDAVRLVGERD